MRHIKLAYFKSLVRGVTMVIVMCTTFLIWYVTVDHGEV